MSTTGKRTMTDGTSLFTRTWAHEDPIATVLLVHGWLASGGINWYRAFDPLAEHFNVVAPDLRGHGRG